MSQQTKFDAASLHANPQTAAKARMPDDGSGTKKIWRVERKGNTYELAELDKKHYGYFLSIFITLTNNLMTYRLMVIVYAEKQSYGPFVQTLKYPPSKIHRQLFGGDSYVILYTYLVNGREYYIIYFWLVSNKL